MKHERETLEAVITARNTAVAGLKTAAKDPSDPVAMKQLAQAEQGFPVHLAGYLRFPNPIRI